MKGKCKGLNSEGLMSNEVQLGVISEGKQRRGQSEGGAVKQGNTGTGKQTRV